VILKITHGEMFGFPRAGVEFHQAGRSRQERKRSYMCIPGDTTFFALREGDRLDVTVVDGAFVAKVYFKDHDVHSGQLTAPKGFALRINHMEDHS
jgi:hypothetical protein